MTEPLRTHDPDRVGAYRIEARLGEGGMGEVFLGRSPGGRAVAVKVIRRELAADARFRARFAGEIAAARRVGGFHTAQVVDADTEAAQPWLVTAYIPGPSLLEVVRRDAGLDAARVRALGAGLAEGLRAIHDSGLVHRDLKPGNVIMADDGPRIIDFGIARAGDATAHTTTGVAIGTFAYMSPEQIRAEPDAPVGPAGDVFSLGCVLAYAATGRTPFRAETIPALVHRVLSTPPDLEGVPAELVPLVTRCLAKEAADRPAVAEVLAELAGMPVAAGGGGRAAEPPPETVTPTRRLPDDGTPAEERAAWRTAPGSVLPGLGLCGFAVAVYFFGTLLSWGGGAVSRVSGLTFARSEPWIYPVLIVPGLVACALVPAVLAGRRVHPAVVYAAVLATALAMAFAFMVPYERLADRISPPWVEIRVTVETAGWVCVCALMVALACAADGLNRWLVATLRAAGRFLLGVVAVAEGLLAAGFVLLPAPWAERVTLGNVDATPPAEWVAFAVLVVMVAVFVAPIVGMVRAYGRPRAAARPVSAAGGPGRT